jgi:hypothetical protein
LASLLILGFVAYTLDANGQWQRLLRLSLLPVAAGYAALPVRRRWLAGPLSISAAILVLFASGWLAAASVGILILVDLTAGPIRESSRSRRPWSSAGSFLTSRIAWRAVGWRILGAYVPAVAALGATALFIGNNAPPANLANGALRLGGSLSLALFLSRLAHKLATRRPAWHFARSLPWSSASRILADCAFMGLLTVPLFIIIAALDRYAVPVALSALPFLSMRASGYIRTIPEHRVHAGLFLLEGFVVSASLALLPWTSLIWLLSAGPAFLSARQRERHQKVSRWQELHFTAEGDTLTWSK